MTRVGIIGFGFIGHIHFNALQKVPGVKVVALADKVAANFGGEAVQGNIAVESGARDLSGVRQYADGDDLLADGDVDVALIALPTHMHRVYAEKAFAAGKAVICEKPLARTSADAEAIVNAARATGRPLFVAQCIRFWPAYAEARKLVWEKTFGRLLRGHFARISPRPTWSWQNWLMDEAKSGGAILDLHIHDVDFVQHLLGAPSKVSAAGIRDESRGYGDVCSTFLYDDGAAVTLEGSWEQPAGFPFRMAFRIVLEQAVLEYDSRVDYRLRVYTPDGKVAEPAIEAKDGYLCEHEYFFHCLHDGVQADLVLPATAVDAVRLVEAEMQSLQAGGAQVQPGC